jgi:predicted Rossmann fold flavoprotein
VIHRCSLLLSSPVLTNKTNRRKQHMKPNTTIQYDAIILGAGAAGLMCALEAGIQGKNVLLVEHNDKVGRKIRISGGGRCNFTNVHTDPSRFISQNPRFCYSALAGYTAQDFIDLIDRHEIQYHERKHGQLFCDDSAQQIIDALLHDCDEAGAEIKTNCLVTDVQKEDHYTVTTSSGNFTSHSLVIATGGLSFERIGASSAGYKIAEQLGLNIIPCEPALVPFILDEDDLFQLTDLSGISFEASASIDKTSFQEAILITHRGLSGPAILQISSYWKEGQGITVELFPGTNLEEELFDLKNKFPKATPKSFLNTHFSSRFVNRLCEMNDWNKPFGETPDKTLRKMAQKLQHWQIPIQDTEGYPKAEVTRGGVDTRQLNPTTMEAKNVPGLYFIGEVMDVTGWLGGYNFQWAWASGVAAGRAL